MYHMNRSWQGTMRNLSDPKKPTWIPNHRSSSPQTRITDIQGSFGCTKLSCLIFKDAGAKNKNKQQSHAI